MDEEKYNAKIQRMVEVAEEKPIDPNKVEVWDVTSDTEDPHLLRTFDTVDEAEKYVAVGMLVHGVLSPQRELQMVVRIPTVMAALHEKDEGNKTVH